jgi:hypothetical protein
MKKCTETLNKFVTLASKTELKLPADMILPLEDFEQITGTLVITTDKNPNVEHQSALFLSPTMIRSVKDFDWAKQFKIIFPKSEEVKCQGKMYYKVPRGEVAAMLGGFFGSEIYYFIPDSRTIVFNTEENVKRFIREGKPSPPKFPWAKDWKHVEHDLGAFAISAGDQKWLKDRRPDKGEVLAATAFFRNSTSLVFGIGQQKEFAFQMFAQTENEEKAAKTAQAIEEFLAECRKGLEQDAKEDPPKGSELVLHGFAKDLQQSSKVTRKGTEVRWRSESKRTLAELVPLIIPEEISKE